MTESTDAVAFTAREVSDGVVVVGVAGELDMATAPAVQEFALSRLAEGDRALVLDLSGVTFFGSTGINLLITLNAACASAGAQLRVVAATSAVLRPLALTDLISHFTIFSSAVEAG